MGDYAFTAQHCQQSLFVMLFLNSAQVGTSIEIPLIGLLFCIIFSTFTYGIAVTHDQAKDWKLALTSIFTTILTIIMVAGTRQTMGLLK